MDEGAGRGAHDVGRLFPGETGDIGEPDQRLDADGGADREYETAQLTLRHAPLQGGKGVLQTLGRPPFAAISQAQPA